MTSKRYQIVTFIIITILSGILILALGNGLEPFFARLTSPFKNTAVSCTNPTSSSGSSRCLRFESISLGEDFQGKKDTILAFTDLDARPVASWPIENDGDNAYLHAPSNQAVWIAEEKASDYTFKLRMNLMKGSAHLSLRSSDFRYFLHIHQAGLELNRQDPTGDVSLLANDGIANELGSWHNYSIELEQDTITVKIDAKERLRYRDPDPLPPGNTKIEIMDLSEALIDEIELDMQKCADLHWSQAGKLPGGGVVSIKVSETNPNVVFFTTNVNNMGNWRSDDAGSTWRRVFQGTHGLGVTIHPSDSETALLLGGQDQIFRTSDGGKTWNQVFGQESGTQNPGQTPGSGHAHGGHHLGGLDKLTGHEKWLTALSYAPSNPEVVYAGNLGGWILRSDDGGTIFRTISDGLPLISALVVDPDHPELVYAGTIKGIFASSDSGGKWRKLDDNIDLEVIALAIHPDDPNILFASTERGVFTTDDRGATWREIEDLHGQDIHRIAISRSKSKVIYLGGHNGIWRSDDTGSSWRTVNEGLQYLDIGGLAVSPTDPDVAYAGNGSWFGFVPYHSHNGMKPILHEGIFKTIDGGRHWFKLAGNFEEVDATEVVVDRNDPAIVYVGTACSRGGYRSTDRGETFAFLPGSNPVQADLMHYTMRIAVGTKDKEALYWTGQSGVAKSSDRGLTWKNLSKHRHFHGLAVDPTDSNIVYVGTAPRAEPSEDYFMLGAHILKSIDGGETWEDKDSGFPHEIDTAVIAIMVDPKQTNFVYAMTSTMHNMEKIALGLYRSVNAGEDWDQINNGMKVDDVNYLAIHPRDTMIMYAATSKGIFKSTDRGDCWALTSFPTLPSRAVLIDPVEPKIVYVGSAKGVYRSNDGGATCYPVNFGLFAIEISGLAIDPTGHFIYAAILGKGVFRAKLR